MIPVRNSARKESSSSLEENKNMRVKTVFPGMAKAVATINRDMMPISRSAKIHSGSLLEYSWNSGEFVIIPFA